MKLISFLMLIAIVYHSEGARCFSCTHSYSLEECLSQGVKYCNNNEDMCESVQRPENGRMVYIKQCKSSIACKNNPKDNKKEVCCCKGEMCNFDHEECNGAPPPTCNVTTLAPANGKLQCHSVNEEGGVKIGSTCQITCSKGFYRRGPGNISCVQKDTGEVKFDSNSGKLTKCIPDDEPELASDHVLLDPPQFDLQKKSCRRKFMSFGITLCMTPTATVLKGSSDVPVGTNCVYRCCRGFRVVGPDETTCRYSKERGAFFDEDAPKCVKRTGHRRAQTQIKQ